MSNIGFYRHMSGISLCIFVGFRNLLKDFCQKVDLILDRWNLHAKCQLSECWQTNCVAYMAKPTTWKGLQKDTLLSRTIKLSKINYLPWNIGYKIYQSSDAAIFCLCMGEWGGGRNCYVFSILYNSKQL